MRTILLLAVAAAIAAYPRPRRVRVVRSFAAREGLLFHLMMEMP